MGARRRPRRGGDRRQFAGTGAEGGDHGFGAGLGPRDRRLGIAHAPFEIPVGEFSAAEFAAAVDRYAAAGFGAADDVAALKLATQRVPGLLFERLALM